MFCELVEDGATSQEFFDQDKQARFEAMSTDEQLWWLAGQLWHCTDCLPGHVCEELELPQGSTYAQAARHIRQSVLVVP